MSYFSFLAEHGSTLLLGTVTTIKVLICATILYVIISIIFGLMRVSNNSVIQSAAALWITELFDTLINPKIMEIIT